MALVLRALLLIPSPKLGCRVPLNFLPASPALLREVSQTHGHASGAGEGEVFSGEAAGRNAGGR